MRESAFDPPALPDDFWQRPDVRHVLACLGLARRQPAPEATPGSASAPGGDPEPENELLRRIASARNIDPSVIQVLQNETDAVRLLDRRLGAPAVAAKLEAHIVHIQD